MTSKISTRTTLVLTAIIIVIIIIVALSFVGGSQTPDNQNPASCSTEVDFIPVVGDITDDQNMNLGSTSLAEADEDTILREIQDANNDPDVKVIVLLIDSNGGDPETAEEISQEMSRVQKPKFALIRGNGDSGAYWIATAADKIFAFQSSDVGDIGVTDSYLSDAQQNADEGLQFIPLTSGPYKDTGNPDKPVTQADKNLLMTGVTQEYNIFVNAVAAGRHMSVAQVTALADGSSVLGTVGVQDGLIDSTGGWDALWKEIDGYLNQPCYFVE